MPFGPNGEWKAFLSDADRREIANRETQARVTAALGSLGRIPNADAELSNPVGRARAALTGLYRTADHLLPNYSAVRAYEDRDVLHEAQETERGERLKALQAAVDQRAKHFVDHAAGALESAALAADQYRPKLDPENTAQLIRTDQAWNNFIRPQLEAGKSWPDVMKTLDADGLLAVQRYAPAYETARVDKENEYQLPSTLAGIERMTQRRLIDVAPEGDARNALQQHADVQQMHDVIQSAAGHLTSLGTLGGIPRNEVVASTQMGIKYAAHQAGAELGEPAQA